MQVWLIIDAWTDIPMKNRANNQLWAFETEGEAKGFAMNNWHYTDYDMMVADGWARVVRADQLIIN